jgi:hypothetical protein
MKNTKNHGDQSINQQPTTSSELGTLTYLHKFNKSCSLPEAAVNLLGVLHGHGWLHRNQDGVAHEPEGHVHQDARRLEDCILPAGLRIRNNIVCLKNLTRIRIKLLMGFRILNRFRMRPKRSETESTAGTVPT